MAALGLLAAPQLALAHAQLVSSSPGAGTAVEQAPAELRLVFSEIVELGYSRVELIDADGQPVPTGTQQLDPGDDRVLILPLEPLADGTYLVSWRALSGADGHVTQGSFSFGVGMDIGDGGGAHGGGHGASYGTAGHGVPPLETLARSLAYAGMGLGFGLAVLGLLVLGPILGGLLPLGLQRLQLGALALAALATIGVGVIGGSGLLDPGGSPADAVATIGGFFLDSRVGLFLAERAAVLALGAAIGLILLQRGRPRAALWVAGGAGFTALLLTVAPSHAAAFDSPAPAAADLVHLAAMSIWFAGLVSLAALVTGVAPGVGGERLRAIVPRFSALALVSVGLLAVSGAYLEWIMTRQLLPLDTSFGRTLTLKVAVALVALVVGGLNYLDGGRGREWLGGLRNRLTLEAGLAFCVIVLTGNLTGDAPPAESRPVPIAPAVSSGAPPAPIELGLQPGRPGPDRILVVLPQRGPGHGEAELLLQRLDRTEDPARIPLAATITPPDTVAAYEAASVLLDPDSHWDATVVILDESGAEWGRQRFSFALDDRGISQGRATPPVPPALLIGAALLAAAVVAGGYWLGGGSLPRTEHVTGRIALASGSLVGAALGSLILFAGPRL
jgi:copper transport protein